MRRKTVFAAAALIAAVVLAAWNGGSRTYAEEEAFVSVELPTSGGESPFDFILDPQGLINATNAARYGGRTFEEGATLYFENEDGEYDFSHTSDFLTITNKSESAVKVSVSAYVDGLSQIGISGSDDFDDSEISIYLALVDDTGKETAFGSDGKAELSYELAGAQDGEKAEYSFGLTGASNPNADWMGVNAQPQITVKWTVDIIEEKTEEKTEEESETETEIETESEAETESEIEEESKTETETESETEIETEEETEEESETESEVETETETEEEIETETETESETQSEKETESETETEEESETEVETEAEQETEEETETESETEL